MSRRDCIGREAAAATYPDVPQGAVFTEGTLNFVFGGGRTQVADIHLTLQVPLPVPRHAISVSINVD